MTNDRTQHRMPCTIEIVHDVMGVMDEDGYVHQTHTLGRLEDAKGKLRQWQHRFAFDYTMARREVLQYFDEQS
ncbi:MAG: hypothetical protein JXA69_07665 [Phycisphaerae bacterium]|nr:hypothetical protein [Phycisphaerae bacterium]